MLEDLRYSYSSRPHVFRLSVILLHYHTQQRIDSDLLNSSVSKTCHSLIFYKLLTSVTRRRMRSDPRRGWFRHCQAQPSRQDSRRLLYI